MNRIKWFPPEKQPICDAIVITDKGKKVWRLWDSAAPGNWEWWRREYGVKKWRKMRSE